MRDMTILKFNYIILFLDPDNVCKYKLAKICPDVRMISSYDHDYTSYK